MGGTVGPTSSFQIFSDWEQPDRPSKFYQTGSYRAAATQIKYVPHFHLHPPWWKQHQNIPFPFPEILKDSLYMLGRPYIVIYHTYMLKNNIELLKCFKVFKMA